MSTRTGRSRLVSCIGTVLLCLYSTTTVVSGEVGQWYHGPLPRTSSYLSPRPTDEEFLEIVPPLRPLPEFSPEDVERGMVVWWGDYSQFLFSEQPPNREDLARQPIARTAPGEDEPLILGLWGIEDVGLVTLQVKESAFPLTIRCVEFASRYVPTRYQGREIEGGRVIGFATHLPEAGTAEVTRGANTVFWINVEVPAGTAPGTYDLLFELIIHQREVIEIPATVEVLDFVLPRADIAFGMYFRPHGFVVSRYTKPHLMRTYWRDMARHGMTSTTLYFYQMAPFDLAGNLQFEGNPDIQSLRDMMEDGLLTADIPIMILSWGPDGIDKAKAISAAQREYGLPEFLQYSRDEPPLTAQVRAGIETEQPVRPYTRLITAMTDLAAIAYGHLIDVWVVHVGVISPTIRRQAGEYRAELWTYDCTARGTGNAPRSRFYAGLYTWALYLKGNFIWCYHEHYSWEGDRVTTHSMVLPSDSGPVPSVAWEARREGVEDYRLLKYLEALIPTDAPSQASRDAAAWLKELRSRVDWYLMRNRLPYDYPWDGAELLPMCPNFSPAELAQIRAQTIEYIEEITADGT